MCTRPGVVVGMSGECSMEESVITIFGRGKATPDDEVFQAAYKVGEGLVEIVLVD